MSSVSESSVKAALKAAASATQTNAPPSAWSQTRSKAARTVCRFFLLPIRTAPWNPAPSAIACSRSPRSHVCIFGAGSLSDESVSGALITDSTSKPHRDGDASVWTGFGTTKLRIGSPPVSTSCPSNDAARSRPLSKPISSNTGSAASSCSWSATRKPIRKPRRSSCLGVDSCLAPACRSSALEKARRRSTMKRSVRTRPLAQSKVLGSNVTGFRTVKSKPEVVRT
mmetsp:Transcript_53972/g.163971  ORF Transcript_53972/g.163971 Transcript_53972/m.163971 type:complete len:226 (+) Transcript_53972:657-1334(+)